MNFRLTLNGPWPDPAWQNFVTRTSQVLTRSPHLICSGRGAATPIIGPDAISFALSERPEQLALFPRQPDQPGTVETHHLHLNPATPQAELTLTISILALQQNPSLELQLHPDLHGTYLRAYQQAKYTSPQLTFTLPDWKPEPAPADHLI